MTPPPSKKLKVTTAPVGYASSLKAASASSNVPANPNGTSWHAQSSSSSSKPSTSRDRMTVDDGDDDDDDDDEDQFFVYDSDVPSNDEEEQILASDRQQRDELYLSGDTDEDGPGSGNASGPKPIIDTITIADSDEEELVHTPPEPITHSDDHLISSASPSKSKNKGKLTSRKQWQNDVDLLIEKYGSKTGDAITMFRKEDELVQFTLAHGALKLRLVIMFPELGGYPRSHQAVCYTENEAVDPNIEQIMSEIASLPEEADRSVSGLLQFLVSRIVHGRPSPYAQSAHHPAETDEDEMDNYLDDDLFSVGASRGPRSALVRALRKDLRELIAEGYRPGVTFLSELDNVVSVAKKVNELEVPVRALQAWDSELITGKVVYLVLLMNFGPKYPVDLDQQTRGQVQFRVGISPYYKPSKAAIATAFSLHSSSDAYTPNDFQPISLSAPLDSLFRDRFQEVIATRRSNESCGWAAAELHCSSRDSSSPVFDRKAARAADKAEQALLTSGAYKLPADPMSKAGTVNNCPLLAYSYLVRRFVMCPRFCLICFKTVDQAFTALKPFVCDSSLCLYQLISLGLGPSLEHEIKTNAPAVDLLIQLAYTAAKEGALRGDHQPKGIALEVPKTATDEDGNVKTVAYEDFDSLDDSRRCAGVVALIYELPSVPEMKHWLEGEGMTDEDRMLRRVRKLSDMKGGNISSSAWRLLRWIVASNTSYLKSIDEDDELIQGVPKGYRQFRLVVGSPAKEHLLAEAVAEAQKTDSNARRYPTLYAFHGSQVKNWHSILREGLHFKETINGRAYGHGVYFAKEGEISLGTYSVMANTSWAKADFPVSKLAALCEIVNQPKEFVSTHPYLVVNKIDWIQCRVLLVQSTASTQVATSQADGASARTVTNPYTVPLDPLHPLMLNKRQIEIPDLIPKLEAIKTKLKNTEENFNISDVELLREPSSAVEILASSQPKKKTRGSVNRTASSGPAQSAASPSSKEPNVEVKEEAVTFVPADEARLQMIRLLPPPSNPNAGAASTIQKEMKALMKSQKEVGPTKAGFYFDPERSNDNLFTWVVELIGFDQELPIAKDMAEKGVNSLLFEIRFGESFPLSPPFFRLVHPRFLPFIHGGGGHVTGGGSICMDLLTASGWSPIYQMEAVLLQIRMAISNLEPRPARLDPQHWNKPYSIQEAVDGFKRAAATHSWQIPADFAAITRA